MTWKYGAVDRERGLKYVKFIQGYLHNAIKPLNGTGFSLNTSDKNAMLNLHGVLGVQRTVPVITTYHCTFQ